MTPAPSGFDPGALLDHTGWVRELAHRLVRDPHLADDLAQETVLAALRETSAPERTRAWLGTVLRRLVWERLRGDDRRAARESTAARDEAIPSTLELVERMTTHRLVVEEVMELPEHYREVLLRRYFEGETPMGIAAQLGVPVPTVKTRLARAHVLLRERLDRRHGGDGQSWLRALAPLAGRARRGGSAALPIGGTLPWWIAAGLVVTVAALVLRDVRWSGARSEPRASAAPPIALGPAPAPDSASAPLAGEARTPFDAGDASAEVVAAARLAHAPSRRVAGRVYGIDGSPASGVLVQLRPYRQEAGDERGEGVHVGVSDADGTFALTGISRAGRVHAASGELVTVFAGDAAPEEGARTTIVVARRHPAVGRVLDEQGLPVVAASVELVLPEDCRASFGATLEGSSSLRFRTVTDRGGAFALDDAPRVPGAALVVEHDGYETVRLPQPEIAATRLDVTLVRAAPSAGRLTGRVVDGEGVPLAQARVSTGHLVVRSDVHGLFEIDVEARSPFGDRPTALVAAKPGLRPVRFVPPRAAATGEPSWPRDVELHLDGPPLTITGRVVDPAGRALRGARVWVEDATVLRDPSHPEDGDSETRRVGSEDVDITLPEVAEVFVLGEGRDDPWVFDVTEADGSFELRGLADREYTLVAMDPARLVRSWPVVAAAGARDVRLEVDVLDVVERLEGRIVDRRGEPVAGVHVRATSCSFGVSIGERALSSELSSTDGMVTGADGRFWLHDFPRRGAFLSLDGRGVLPRKFGWTGAEAARLAAGGELEPVVDRLARFRVDLDAAGGASMDEVELRDADGKPLQLHSLEGQSRWVRTRAAVTMGRSEVVQVSDAAVEARLYTGGTLVRVAPVRLEAGTTTTLDR